MTALHDEPSAPPRRPRTRGRKRGTALVLLAALVAGAALAAGELLPAGLASAADPDPVQVEAADQGSAWCPVVVAEDETAQLEIASASADRGSEVVVTTFVDGLPTPSAPLALEPGRAVVVDIPPEQRTSPVKVDWRGGPVVAQYRIIDDVERAVSTCATQPSDRWHLAGFDTTRGSRSLLYLFNPFGQDAVVRLTFGTPEGPVDLVIADEITVPAGRVEVRDLADFRPETADLAVTVSAEVGRVVPQGQLVRGPAGEGLEGITGRALVPAAPAAGEQVLIPDALVDEVTTSWLTLYNPEDRAAAVELSVTTPLDTAVQLAAELTVPAGGTTRVDLAELSALPRFGVRAASVNGIGVVATRTTAVQDGDRRGIAVSGGVPAASERWVVPGARPPDAVLTLYNPGAAVATAAVTTAGGQPDGWAAVELPPNAVVELPVEGEDPQGAALVRADAPIVAGVVSLAEGPSTSFASATGVAVDALTGAGAALPARRDPGLASRPAVSATATPTPTTAPDDGGGEGRVDAAPTTTPTIVAPPTVTPTPSPGLAPASPEVTPTPTPTATGTGPPATPPATPTSTEESLFG